MNDRQARWHSRLYRLDRGNPQEPLVLDEDMIERWLQEHRKEYDSATKTIKACMANFRLHRRHRKWVWGITPGQTLAIKKRGEG